MKRTSAVLLAAAVVLSAHLVAGCNQVRGRRLLQKASQQYHEGQYAAAVVTFHEAEQFLPELLAALAERGHRLPPIDGAGRQDTGQ